MSNAPAAVSRSRSDGTQVVVCEAELTGPQTVPFCEGTVVLYTDRCPDKETPNEDSVAVLQTGPRSGVLVVADGVGGARGGHHASALAIHSIREALAVVGEDPEELRRGVLNGIEEANKCILEMGVGAATTLSVVVVHEQTIRPYHIGDSMIVLTGQRGRVKLQTVPHSPPGLALEAGVIDEQEAINHADRHVVTNFVGSETMRIEMGSTTSVSPRDTLLLASDGLSDNFTVDEIVEYVRRGPLEDSARKLICEARRRMAGLGDWPDALSKPDDLSLVAFRPGSAA